MALGRLLLNMHNLCCYFHALGELEIFRGCPFPGQDLVEKSFEDVSELKFHIFLTSSKDVDSLKYL